MKKALMILGFSLLSSQASAEIDCAEIKSFAEGSYSMFTLFAEQADEFDGNERLFKKAMQDAQFSLENTASYATIYLAFCKD